MTTPTNGSPYNWATDDAFVPPQPPRASARSAGGFGPQTSAAARDQEVDQLGRARQLGREGQPADVAGRQPGERLAGVG